MLRGCVRTRVLTSTWMLRTLSSEMRRVSPSARFPAGHAEINWSTARLSTDERDVTFGLHVVRAIGFNQLGPFTLSLHTSTYALLNATVRSISSASFSSRLQSGLLRVPSLSILVLSLWFRLSGSSMKILPLLSERYLCGSSEQLS